MKTVNKILIKVDCKYGAPLGRINTFPDRYTIETINGKLYMVRYEKKKRIFDSAVPMIGSIRGYGVYDIGGVYWGYGKQLRVKYTKDLSYIKFYRK